MSANNKKGSAQQTLQMIECGNLDLNFPIKYGTLLLGKTKRGKTTSAHYLMHQILKGGYNDHNSIVYILDNGQARFSSAKIGQKQSQSQTQIPNFFDYQENNQKKYLIDCPGYLDSFGCYRIISNRFFHFQVFSKVQNIRFIITFCWNDMQWTADSMFQAFRQFFSGFSNLKQIGDQLIGASCILITSVPDQKDLDSVRQRYKATSLNIGSQLQEFYQKFKQKMIQKKKVFMFRKAKLGQYCDIQNTLFKEINQSTNYWQRKMKQDGMVDMKNIKISIDEYLQKDKFNFNKQLTQLRTYYSKHFDEQIKKFILVIQQLVLDNKFNNQEDLNSCKFIQKMKNISLQKQRWRKSQQCKCLFLYQKYQDKRNKLKDAFFKPSFILSDPQNNSDVPFWLLKIKSLHKIEKLCAKMAQQEKQRQIQKLDQISKIVKNILQTLITLAKSKRTEDNNIKNKLVLDFAYQVFKVIQISNKIYRLIKATTNQNNKDSVKDLNQKMYFLLIQYPKNLKEIFLKAISESSAQIFIQNMNKIDTENLTEKGSSQVAQFLEDFQVQIQNIKIQRARKLNKSELSGLNQNIFNKIAKLKANSFAFTKKASNLSLQLLFKIEQQRQKILKKIIEANQNAANNQRLKGQHNRIVHVMAQCLFKNSKYQLALQLYESLFDADKIFQIMDIMQQNIKKQKLNKDINRDNLLNHYIDYMNRARKYYRKELAIKKAQKAFHIAQDNANLQKIAEISNFIREVSMNKALEQDVYLQALLKQVVQAKLSKQLIQKILNTVKATVSSPVKKSN